MAFDNDRGVCFWALELMNAAEFSRRYAVFRLLAGIRARVLANLASQAIKTGLATKMEE